MKNEPKLSGGESATSIDLSIHQSLIESTDANPSDEGNAPPHAAEPRLLPKREATSKMNGKPVLHRAAKTVLSLDSTEFGHKLLCDDAVLNLGDACAFGCNYCYVGQAMAKIVHEVIKDHDETTGQNHGHSDVVIRRSNAISLLRRQLVDRDGQPLFNDSSDTRVVFTSTTVDPAANKELLKETAESIRLILENTHWQVRVLSKSALVEKLIDFIPEEYHDRLIIGLSIGTLDDRLAKAIETGTSSPTRRVKALLNLQDRGIRTFGMLCPSLPQVDYDEFSRQACEAIRADRCEHVWAEVLNVRGNSMTRVTKALRQQGYNDDATRLEEVSGAGNGEAWEAYAKETFLAHVRNVPAGKLRFLQYVTSETADWWADQRKNGAVPLGKEAGLRSIHAPGTSAQVTRIPKLALAERLFLEKKEQLVSEGVKASLAAAKALWEIYSHRGGVLWKRDYHKFEDYCAVKWGISKAHAYRTIKAGEFLHRLESPNGDSSEQPRPLPLSEGQVRPLLEKVPADRWVECWEEVSADPPPTGLTGALVDARARDFLRRNKLGEKPRPKRRTDEPAKVLDWVEKIRRAVTKHPSKGAFDKLLDDLVLLARQPVEEQPGESQSQAPADQLG